MKVAASNGEGRGAVADDDGIELFYGRISTTKQNRSANHAAGESRDRQSMRLGDYGLYVSVALKAILDGESHGIELPVDYFSPFGRSRQLYWRNTLMLGRGLSLSS